MPLAVDFLGNELQLQDYVIADIGNGSLSVCKIIDMVGRTVTLDTGWNHVVVYTKSIVKMPSDYVTMYLLKGKE